MDSVLQLIIGAAVVCLVLYLEKVLIGPGESHVSPDPTVEPPQIDHTISAGGSSAPLAAPVPSPPEPRALTRVANIPKCVIFFDVETTGLNSNDRVVTLAAVTLLNTNLLPSASLEYLYLIFDPGRKSHPGAEAIHGYSDWILRHQELRRLRRDY